VPLRDDAKHRAVLRLLDELLASGQPAGTLATGAMAGRSDRVALEL
jgi:hypothetical protein